MKIRILTHQVTQYRAFDGAGAYMVNRTSVTYIDPDGRHGSATTPGMISQEAMRQWLAALWKQWSAGR